MEEKRRCIFTGKIADKKLVIPPGKIESHNWAKSVPCSSDFLQVKNGSPLNPLEMELVDLFYQKELSRIKIINCEARMDQIRKALEFSNLKKETLIVSEEAFDQLTEAIENPPEPNEKLKEAFFKLHKEAEPMSPEEDLLPQEDVSQYFEEISLEDKVENKTEDKALDIKDEEDVWG